MLGTLLAPTFASILFCGSLIILISAGITIQYGKGGLYALAFGADSPPDFINSAQATYSTYYNNIFGNSVLNSILFFVFWMLIGLVVYVFIILVGKGAKDADEVVHEINYVHIKKDKLIEQLEVRAGVRAAIFIMTGVYTVAFLKTLFPFSLASLQIAAGSLPKLSGVGYGLQGVLALSLSLHIYVVLIRLFLLRLRAFESS